MRSHAGSPLRFIRSDPLDAYMNMAIDEALYSSFCDDPLAIPVFRIYQWKGPSFSIGVSQNPQAELDLEKCKTENVPYVRRMTGGGIIFHDDEITYSFIVPENIYAPGRPVAESFKSLCAFLMIFYRKLGLEPCFAVDKPYNGVIGASSPFCFAGREKYDIVVHGKKIGGNAQKRKHGIIFQHGSIPLSIDRRRIQDFSRRDCSTSLTETVSLNEITDYSLSIEESVELLKSSLREAFGVSIKDDVLSAEELALARKLRDEKYITEEWNIYRNAHLKQREKAGVA